MNVVLSAFLLVVAMFAIGAVGGCVNGLIVADGHIKPERVTGIIQINDKEAVGLRLWDPGIIVHAIFGGVAGVLIFCVCLRPMHVLSSGRPLALTLYEAGVVLLVGFLGSVAINDRFEKRQWAELAPSLLASDPERAKQLLITRSSRPAQVLRKFS